MNLFGPFCNFASLWLVSYLNSELVYMLLNNHRDGKFSNMLVISFLPMMANFPTQYEENEVQHEQIELGYGRSYQSSACTTFKMHAFILAVRVILFWLTLFTVHGSTL